MIHNQLLVVSLQTGEMAIVEPETYFLGRDHTILFHDGNIMAMPIDQYDIYEVDVVEGKPSLKKNPDAFGTMVPESIRNEQ